MKKLLVAALLTMVLAAQSAAGTISIAYGPDRYSKSPHYFNFCILSPNPQVTEPLVELGPDFTPRPGLVKSWQKEPDGSLRLFLRKDVRFHNGRKLDARAALAALRWFGNHLSDFLHLDYNACKALDEHTLVLKAKPGYARLLENLTHPLVAMLWTQSDPAKGPVGTGPFVFKRYDRNQRLVLEANPSYWGARPANQKLRFLFAGDDQVRLMTLASGQADIAYPLNPGMLAGLGPEQLERLVVSKPVKYIGLSVNLHGEAPFDILRDARVRRALAYAIDRKAIVKHQFRDYGQPARALLPPVFWGLGQDFLRGFEFDPQKAEALLDRAGWLRRGDGVRRRNGRELRLRLVSGWPGASQLKPIPEILQQMLKRVGVALDMVQTDDHGVYYGTYMKPGKADLFLDMGFNSSADPTFLLFLLFHSKTPWVSYGQNWFFAGPEFDAAVDRARQSRDRAEVMESIRQAQRILIDEKTALIPIAFVPDFYLVRPGVKFEPAAMEYLNRYGYATKAKSEK